MSFNKVDPKQSFPRMEEEILKFWEENKIFEKSVERSAPKGDYVFYDGPPFATGTPHYGHIVASTMKDVVPRYWTMKGYKVERKWGWDCHGLPIENIAEKELGIKRKTEIEEMGVEKFNEFCRSKVLGYVDEWKKVINRLGRWADMENAYKTMDLPYMESIWYVFKELWDKGLIYEGYRSMHICTRCETTLSQQEVSEGYKDIKDLSATVKFKIKYRPNKTGRGVGALITNDKNEILLIRRNEKGRRTTWALAGGKVEHGESFREALEREVKEELGIKIVSARAISRKPDILEGRLFETLCYEVKINEEPKLMLSEEMDKMEWFPLDNLPEIDYPPSRDAIEILKKNLNEKIDENINIPLPEVYIVAWTTTPWTLVGNVALAIGENIKYVLVKCEDKYFILAKDRIEKNFKDKEYEIINEIFGKDLDGLEYEPLFNYYNGIENAENGWKIYSADFVTTEEGTGVVHIAPAFGEDDLNLGKEKNLPFIQHTGMDGIIKKEATDFAGLSVKPAEDHQSTDIEIIKYLAKNNLLFAKEKYEHSYPHCWRCDTPLINYATSSWFVNVTKVKERALELAKDINWSPKHIKEGRFGNWLEGARDWSISRQRYWASVMPIWKCECGEIKVFGSVKELEEASGEKITDLHKHIVDKITFKCEKCSGEMKRIPDVLDTWFDSGSMPYAQMHYPFENKEKFEDNFPAEFIAEGQDQCRAWFYYLHVIATAIKDSRAFNNVIVNGTVVGEDGKKLSKRLNNYPDPMEMLEKYGADSLRFYLMSSPVVSAENLAFKESDVSDIVRGMMRMLWNSYSFFALYADIDKWTPKENSKPSENLLDKWMLSELNLLIKEVNMTMENYELNKTGRLFPKFVDNLSNWYIRRSRKRFWKSEDDGDKESAYQTLYIVLTELAKLMAPFTPFIAEEIYKNLTRQDGGQAGEESVHLAEFPVADEKLIDEKLNSEMEKTRVIITEALQLRAKAGVKVRQPLQSLSMKHETWNSELVEIIKDELNVKVVLFNKDLENNILLDTEITPELKLEGQAREVIRAIQEMRKEAGYEVDNRIKVGYIGLSEVFEKFGEIIKKETLAEELNAEGLKEVDLEKEFNIDGNEIKISIKK